MSTLCRVYANEELQFNSCKWCKMPSLFCFAPIQTKIKEKLHKQSKRAILSSGELGQRNGVAWEGDCIGEESG